MPNFRKNEAKRIHVQLTALRGQHGRPVAANATSRHNADDDDAAARAGQHARRTRKGWGKKSIARTIGRTRKGWGEIERTCKLARGVAIRDGPKQREPRAPKGFQRVPKGEGAGDDG